MRLVRFVTVDEVFKSVIDLFTGKSLIWYRAYGRLADNWHGLTRLLRHEFKPVDYDERLFEEIKTRTQGREKSIEIYFSVMEGLLSRL